jgi:hypothetical protein
MIYFSVQPLILFPGKGLLPKKTRNNKSIKKPFKKPCSLHAYEIVWGRFVKYIIIKCLHSSLCDAVVSNFVLCKKVNMEGNFIISRDKIIMQQTSYYPAHLGNGISRLHDRNLNIMLFSSSSCHYIYLFQSLDNGFTVWKSEVTVN